MKRIIALILLCLGLTGCYAGDPPEETTAIPMETTLAQPTEPAGSYDPGSELEEKTGGAVRVYTPDIPEAYSLVCMEGEVVIFSGLETTTLTKLTGENLYATASTQLDCFIFPESCTTRITQKGITYYDSLAGAVVMLDTTLKEVGRIQAPDDMMGEPILSANRKTLYYCTADAVRAMDLESGISRMLKQISCPEQTVSGLLLDDTVLQCTFSDGESRQVLYLSTENGTILNRRDEGSPLLTQDSRYYLKAQEGSMTALVFGEADGAAQILLPKDLDAVSYFLPDANAAVTTSREASTLKLNYYDLDSGLRLSALEFEDMSLRNVDADGETGYVYILADVAITGNDVLYRWEPERLPTNDTTVYTETYYTREAPDENGLTRCQTYAAQIGAQYGVEIRVGEDALQAVPWDYDLEVEYQVPLIIRDLTHIENLLASFPEGIFKTAAEGTESGVLKISLVRGITGSPESGSLDTVDSIHYRHGGDTYICLTVGQDLDHVFYHEMYHALESRLLSESSACYEWDRLNPNGFTYDFDYVANRSRVENAHTTDEDRYFIDTYSMSFPSEDRARILEYACLKGNESYFQSEAMQKKLLAICEGIREAFGLKKSVETFLWEQYLNESLAYSK